MTVISSGCRNRPHGASTRHIHLALLTQSRLSAHTHGQYGFHARSVAGRGPLGGSEARPRGARIAALRWTRAKLAADPSSADRSSVGAG